jgi:hypothetical protein
MSVLVYGCADEPFMGLKEEAVCSVFVSRKEQRESRGLSRIKRKGRGEDKEKRTGKKERKKTGNI